MSEKHLHIAVCNYLKLQYKNVIFFSEPSGIHLTSWNQRKFLKATRSNAGKLPDLFLAQRSADGKFAGMFLELKVNSIFMKDGKTLLKNPHTEAQAETLARLRKENYFAEFGCGFDQCKLLIDNYLKKIIQ